MNTTHENTNPARGDDGKFIKTAGDGRTREEQGIDEAVAVLEQFVTLSADYQSVADGGTGTLQHPKEAISFDQFVAAKCVAHPRLDHTAMQDLDLMRRAMQKVLADRATDEMTRLDRVTLDTEGAYGNQPWLATDVPQVVFCALTSQDVSFVTPSGVKAQAMALWFDPEVAGTWQPKPDRVTGEIRQPIPNKWAPEGYTEIVGLYTTVEAANEAQAELRRAVRTLATPPFVESEDGESGDVPDVGAILTAL